MMPILRITTAVLCLITLSNLNAQTVHKRLMKGDAAYIDTLYSQAELNYRLADNEDPEFKTAYNLGNSVYKQGRYEEAGEHFSSALQMVKDSTLKANVLHNLGNARFMTQKIPEAIEFYKQALKFDQSMDDTRYNLLVAREIMKNAQPQEQQQQQSGEQGENQEQQDQDQEEQQEQQQNQEQNQEGDQQEQQDQEQQEGDQENEADSGDNQDKEGEQEIQEGAESIDTSALEKQSLDSLEAENLLKIIEDEEAKVQEKLKKFNSDRKKSDKDW